MLSRRKLIFLLPFVISAAFIPVSEVYAVFIDAFDVSSQETLPRSVAFNTDGTKMFVMGVTGDDVNEYACTAFDVSTCTFTDSFSVQTEEISPQSLAFNAAGTKMFVMGSQDDDVNEYGCTTGFDVSTCSFTVKAGNPFSIVAEEGFPVSLAFNAAGTKMFVLGGVGKDVNEYGCTTGFDVSTCSFTVKAGNPFPVAAQDTAPSGLAFNTDGTKMFVLGATGADVNEYACTAFDVSTCTYSGDGERFDVSAQDTSPKSLAFNTDGTKMFVVGDIGGEDVNEYSCATGFDVSTCRGEVTILKTVNDVQPVEGNEIEYTVLFTNNEGVSLASVIITDSLPSGVTFVSFSATQGSYNDGTGQWSIGTVANGASATLTITVSVDSGTGTNPVTPITNTASYTSSTPTATNPSESDSAPIAPKPTTTWTGNGDGLSWSDDANWDNDNPTTFGTNLGFSNVGIFIPSGFTVYGDTSFTITGRMIIDSGSEFVIKSSTNFNNDQDMLIKSGATVTVYGTFSSSGSGDVNNGTIVDCGTVTDWTGTINTSPCDVTAPNPVITSLDVANGGTTNEADGIIEFNVDFGELIAPLTFGTGDISVTGTGTESTPTTTDNRNYQFSVDSGTAVESAVTVQLTVGGTATDLAGNTQTATPSYSYTLDNVAPTFAIQYFSDVGLTTSLGDNPILIVGRTFVRITANEPLTGTPTISFDAEGTANDVTSATTSSVGGSDTVFRHTRIIAIEAAAVGTTLEDVSITGTDVPGNTATNVNPTNEATKAAFTNTPLGPTLSGTLYSVPHVDEFDEFFQTIDSTDASTLTDTEGLGPDCDAELFEGYNGLARDPTNGFLYAIGNCHSFNDLFLLILNPSDGSTIFLGQLSFDYEGLAIDNSGNIFAVTGTDLKSLTPGSSVTETQVCTLTSENAESAFAFNTDDGLFYRVAGTGTGLIFEKITDTAPTTCTTTSITLSSQLAAVASTPEAGALVYLPSETSFLFASGFFSGLSAPSLYTLTPAGVGTIIFKMDEQSNGLAFVPDPVDVTAPTVVSAKITGPNEITVVYDEPVASVPGDYTSLVLTAGGSRTVTAVAGSPGTTHILTFDGAAVATDETATMTISLASVFDDFGNNLAAVVGQTVTDGQAPTFTASRTLATSITLTFSEDVDAAAADENNAWTLSDSGTVTATTDPASTNTMTLTFSGIPDTSIEPTVTYVSSQGTVADVSTQTNEVANGEAAVAQDDAPPTFTASRTLATEIVLTFTENINAAADENAAWVITSPAMTTQGTTAAAGVNTITLTTSNTGETSSTPTVTYVAASGTASDVSAQTNEVANGEAAVAQDDAPPTFTAIRSDVNTFDLTFSESVTATIDQLSGWTVASGGNIVSTDAVASGTTMTITTDGFAATDTAGTPLITYVAASNDVIDLSAQANEMANGEFTNAVDQVPPVVTSIVIPTLTTAGTIADADICAGNCFTIDVTFSENMLQSLNAVIGFTPTTVTTPASGRTLTDETGGYTSDTVFRFTFDIEDNRVDENTITITISTAKDAAPAENQMVAHLDSTVFDIDTFNPFIPISTLTISSNNAVSTLAKAGDIVTITLDASEALSAPVNDDATIQGEADFSGDGFTSLAHPGAAAQLVATRTMQTGDAEGIVQFSIQFRDLFGNLGDADSLGSLNSPEVATHLLTTDGSQVVYDQTGPAGTVVVLGASETIYLDNDASGDVTATSGSEDRRLANALSQGFADNSLVAFGNTDIDESLIAFLGTEKHDNTDADDTFDVGETVYSASGATVAAGNMRLVNAASQGFADGSEVAQDSDIGTSLFTFAPQVKFVDVGDAGFDGGESLYQSTASTVTVGDIRISTPGGDGTTVAAGDTDVGVTLTSFAGTVRHDNTDADDTFDVGETVYSASGATVAAGNIRLANTGSDGSTVAQDSDIGRPIIAFAAAVHEDSVAATSFDIDETHTFARLVQLRIDCDPSPQDSAGGKTTEDVSKCDKMIIDEDNSGSFDGGESFVAVSPVGAVTLSAVRGDKTVNIKFRDEAGNEGSIIMDDIRLDSIITELSATPAASNAEPIWEKDDVTLSATVLHATGSDKMRFDADYSIIPGATFDQPASFWAAFPNPVQDVTLTPASDSSSASLILEYPRPSKNAIDDNPIHTLTPTATLVACGEGCSPVKDVTAADIVEVVASSNLVDVQERATTTFLQPILNPFATNNFGVVGKGSAGLQDNVDLTGIPLKLIEFDEEKTRDGTTVADGDTDVGDSLDSFTPPSNREVKFVDGDAGTAMVFDSNELLYQDVDTSGFVSTDDIRIANHPFGSTGDGTTVAGVDTDVGATLETFSTPVKFVNVAPPGFDVNELLYQDVDTSGDVSTNDIRIANHPATIRATLTHIGLTIIDDEVMVIDGTVAKLNLPAAGADSLGSRIQTLHLPGFVTLTIDNLGGREVELSVTDGADNVSPVFRHSADLINPYILTVSDPDGIKEIQVREISSIIDIADPLDPEPIDGATLDVSNISTFGDELDKVDDVDFDFVGTPTLQTFDVGFFFSGGFAQSVPVEDLPVRPEFFAKDSLGTPDADPDYLACTGECAELQTYDVLFNNNPGEGRKLKTGGGGGGGGEEPAPDPGTATIIQDSGVGIGVIQCVANVDGDGLCDDHEVNGVPFWNLGKIDFYPYDAETFDHEPSSLPGGPTVGIRDILVEIDFMKGLAADCPTCTDGDHTPDPKSLDDVVKMYEDNGVRLLINVDEAVEHEDLTSMWEATHDPTDAADQSVTSGYNEITSIHFGTDNIHPTITRPQINDITPVAPDGTGDYLITISGLTVTTPCNPHTTINPNTSQLTIKSNVVIQISEGRKTVTAPGLNGAVPLSPSVGFNYNPPVVLSIQKQGTIHIVNFEVTATAGFGFGNTCGDAVGGGGTPVVTSEVTLGDLTIPIHITSTTAFVLDKDDASGTQSITLAPHPKIISEMQIAYAQGYRHFLWGHSMGGPGGVAEIRGNNAAVMTGVGFGPTRADRINVDITHDGGDRYIQSGLFGHELGHTVNLLHGGPVYFIGDSLQTPIADVTENCKPLYDNIMSYSGQLPGVYLSLSTDPGTGDVLPSSEWQLTYSDGTHGINPFEVLFDPAHVDDVITRAGLNPANAMDRAKILVGLDESALNEEISLPGTEKTVVWGTPANPASHRGPHQTHKALSTSAGFDWNDSSRKGDASGIVLADINNLGIGGCGETLSSPVMFDYDDFFHMDPDFTQGPSGQFDFAITILNPDVDPDFIWESILRNGVFDGFDHPAEDGSTIAQANSVVTLNIRIKTDDGTPLNLDGIAFAQVFVTKDITVTNEVAGVSDGDLDPLTGDPRKEWVQVSDNNGDNLTPLFMLWIDDIDPDPTVTTDDKLSFDWKLPRKGTEFNGKRFNVEGEWFIRVVMGTDPDTLTPFTCDTSDADTALNPGADEDGNGLFEICLAGELGNPSLNYLIDTVGNDAGEKGTTLPDDGPPLTSERELATGKITITKGGPGEKTPPAEQELPEMDDLIANLNSFIDSKDIQKKTGKDLRTILNNGKEAMLDNNELLACSLVNQFEDDVVAGVAKDRVSSGAAASLLGTGTDGSKVVLIAIDLISVATICIDT